jgi:hypothetical protein
MLPFSQYIRWLMRFLSFFSYWPWCTHISLIALLGVDHTISYGLARSFNDEIMCFFVFSISIPYRVRRDDVFVFDRSLIADDDATMDIHVVNHVVTNSLRRVC